MRKANYDKNDLITAARLDYDAIQQLMPQRTGDERFINLICYLYQQAIEKTLKALIVQKGESFSLTHDITLLCQECVSVGIELSGNLFIYAPIITDWEAKTRYHASIYATIQQIDFVDGLYHEIDQLYRSFESNAELGRMDFFGD